MVAELPILDSLYAVSSELEGMYGLENEDGEISNRIESTRVQNLKIF
jgi:hypothetical protein